MANAPAKFRSILAVRRGEASLRRLFFFHFRFRLFSFPTRFSGGRIQSSRSQRASIFGSMAETLGKGTFLSHCGSRSGYISPPRRPFLAQFAPFSISPLRTHYLASPSKTDFFGMRVEVEAQTKRCLKSTLHSDPVKMGLSFVKAKNRWWMKELQPNMKEITSARDLVNSLLSAGEKLVVVDFFSPGCGGCRALHPKICQIAEKNPDVLFLQVNYEEHKSMCYSLNVHVLPFFRFYRGAHGRLCSFSCTNATIKKFKDALGKHNTERCSLGPVRGLEEAELLSLAANKDLCFAKETGEKALAAAGG